MSKPDQMPVLLAAALERLGATVAVFHAEELLAVQKHGGIEARPQADGSVAVVILEAK